VLHSALCARHGPTRAQHARASGAEEEDPVAAGAVRQAQLDA